MLARDGEWTVRDAIALQLGKLARIKLWKEEDNSRMLSLLVTLCHDSQSVQVRMSAATSLAMIHHPHRLLAWLNLARDREAKIRFSGAVCLGKVVLGASLDQQSMATVVQELAVMAKLDESFTVRKTALKSLAAGAKTPAAAAAAVEALAVACADFAWPVRVACCESLPLVVGAATGDRLANLLLPLIESDSNDSVRLAGRRNLGWFLAQNPAASPEPLVEAFAKLATSEVEEQRFLFAFYLPGVLARNPLGWDGHFKPAFGLVCNDISGRIRRSLAHSLHLLQRVVDPNSLEQDLLPVFYSFLNDMDDEEEVKLGAVRVAAPFLSALRPELRAEAFAKVQECLDELDSETSVSLALSRDARLALASDLPQIAGLGLERAAFGAFFLQLAQDQAQLVRERAVEAFGLVCGELDPAVLDRVLGWASETHFSWRYLFCRAARSAKLHAPGVFEEHFAARLAALAQDPVLAVRQEA